MRKTIEANFILIILALSGYALVNPAAFLWLKSLIPAMLGIIIFGIGLTLNKQEFKQVWNMRGTVIFVTLLRCALLATVAYCIGLLLNLSLVNFIGLIIVGTCPGGTAANVMSYLSKANVALTVTLTFCTTLLSPIIMPALIYIFLHKHITIHYIDMLKNIIFIVFCPLIGGIIFNTLFGKVKTITQWFPVVSIGLIALAIACIMALSQQKIIAFPLITIFAVILLNVVGYLSGFLIGTLMHCKPKEKKSIALEYGLFDVGIGVVIATLFFEPAAALPAALMSIIQNLTASMIVKWSARSRLPMSDIVFSE
jgi:BASS family bile acid:Na+ symporter